MNLMRLSTKARFAVDAMIDLALREADGPVALAAIAARQQISLSYLELLFARLRRQGLVESTRGPGGGYRLGRPARDITLADMVCAASDPAEAAPADPVAHAAPGSAMTQELWDRLDGVMLRHMSTIALATLADEQRALGVVVERRPRRRATPALPAPVRTTAPNSVFAFGRSFATK
jgi:Rrf2 family transcriptional regulator, iron-sulfur cluster assembly transcription factor